MKVYAFHGQGGVWGFTEDPTGSNLPIELGPWRSFKIVSITKNMIGADPDQVIADIERQGYHIASPSIKVGAV